MKTKNTLLLVSILSGIITSCNMMEDKPDKVFQTIALNANLIPSDFSRIFKEIQQHKTNGSLKTPLADGKTMNNASAVEFVSYRYTKSFENIIENVQKLSQNDETKPIVSAALQLFQYADEVYKKDFPAIAKLIDDGSTAEQIDAAIQQLNNSKGAELQKKYEATMMLILPYADKHGVEYKTIDTKR